MTLVRGATTLECVYSLEVVTVFDWTCVDMVYL